MASINKKPNGRKEVQFVADDGKRRTIRVGKATMKVAEEIRTRVEHLNAAKISGLAVDGELARWLSSIGDTLADKLAAVGLIQKRKGKTVERLGPFVEGYIERRHDVVPDTRRIWRQTARKLNDAFGADRPLTDFTRGNATDWRLSLIKSGLADASVRKHCGFAKHFFAKAVEHELIDVNPFGKLVSSPVGNKDRQFFVTREAIAQVIEAAPSAEWRLIIALSRYGGLRCPSEHMALKWCHVDWEKQTMQVISSKTKSTRLVPLFHELRPYLDAVRNESADDAVYVISQTRMAGGNLRTQMGRIVDWAGLTPWPRIFHNQRSSRQTELEEVLPTHAACAIMGNSPQVAGKHYLQLTDDHFRRALESGAESGAVAVQNPVQHPAAESRDKSQASPQVLASQEVMPTPASLCDVMHKRTAEVHGNRTHRTDGSRRSQRL